MHPKYIRQIGVVKVKRAETHSITAFQFESDDESDGEDGVDVVNLN